MDDAEKQKIIDTKILVGKLLGIGASSIITTQEKFSGWMLAGFGAAFTLLLSNIESVSKFIPLEDIRSGVILFLIALAFGVMQRMIGASVMAGSIASAEAEKLKIEEGPEIDIKLMLKEIEGSMFYPMRWYVSWQFKKLEQGDFSVSGRMQATMAQVSSFFVFVQTVLVIFSITIVINGLV